MNPGILVLLAASAAALPTEAEMTKALEPWQQCLQATAARLDDGQTAFYTLGKTVTDTCHPVFERVTDELTKNLAPDDQKKLRNGLVYIEAGSGNVAIMRHRTGQPPP